MSKLLKQRNKSPQYHQQAEPEQCKSKVEKMYLSKFGNWPSISENIGAMQQIIPLKKLYLKVVKLRSNMKQ